MQGDNAPPNTPHSPKGFCLAAGDITLLRLIYEHRFARIDHLVILSGRSYKKIHGRVLKLVVHGYLKRITLPLQKHIYSLGIRAVPVLVEHGTAPSEVLGRRLRSHELKELFLKHELMLVDIHVMLTAASNSATKLVAWSEGKGLYDRVEVADDRTRRFLPVRPDAVFVLEDTTRPTEHNHLMFFVEADRSTTTHVRFEEKLLAYWHYLKQGLYTKKYGARSFRVVTVALTNERAINLCIHAARVLPPRAHRYFLFGSFADITLQEPTRILEPVFATPRDHPAVTERQPLVGRRLSDAHLACEITPLG